MTASQISHGRENDLFIEVDGTKGVAGVAPGGAEQAARPQERRAAEGLHAQRRAVPRGGGGRGDADCRAGTRKAFFEAFANVYTAAYDAIVKRAAGEKFETVNTDLPERVRRRRGDELHHAVRGEQQGQRPVAAVPAPEESEVGNM